MNVSGKVRMRPPFTLTVVYQEKKIMYRKSRVGYQRPIVIAYVRRNSSLLITSVDFIVLIDENDALYRFIKVVFQLFFRWLLLVWIGLN